MIESAEPFLQSISLGVRISPIMGLAECAHQTNGHDFNEMLVHIWNLMCDVFFMRGVGSFPAKNDYSERWENVVKHFLMFHPREGDRQLKRRQAIGV